MYALLIILAITIVVIDLFKLQSTFSSKYSYTLFLHAFLFLHFYQPMENGSGTTYEQDVQVPEMVITTPPEDVDEPSSDKQTDPEDSSDKTNSTSEDTVDIGRYEEEKKTENGLEEQKNIENGGDLENDTRGEILITDNTVETTAEPESSPELNATNHDEAREYPIEEITEIVDDSPPKYEDEPARLNNEQV